MKRPLPVGVDNFEKIIRGGYYYTDKTMFIKELLDLKGEVNLFTSSTRTTVFFPVILYRHRENNWITPSKIGKG